MLSDSRIDIKVDFSEKDKAKALGAKWDNVKKSWYIPQGLILENFREWLPEDFEAMQLLEDVFQKDAVKGISLSLYLSQVTEVIAKAFPKSEWIKCEISDIRHSKGHVYLEVVEYDQNRQLVGKTTACIWHPEGNFLLEKFSAETGGSFEPNMKVMLRCKANFQPKSGLRLIVEDIDPAYTLGDMAAKLEKIRQQLKQAGIFENNKKLTLPADFFRIAVIAPKEAAGLGDFQEEAKKLVQANLCDFQYFYAIFQGTDAPSSLILALEEVLKELSRKPFDALVIIRGGGAVTDLAWLNDEMLAKELCVFPLPLLTGIGHEKDNTILDEIAKLRCGTPSKVIQHIVSTIYQAAQQAISHISEITQTVQTLLMTTRNNLENYNEKTVLLAKSHLDMLNQTLSQLIFQVEEKSQNSLKIIEMSLENIIKEIMGFGPEAILKRGYAITSSKEGKVVTSTKEALAYSSLKLTFRDGSVHVNQPSIVEE